jgi:hypothetical protein
MLHSGQAHLRTKKNMGIDQKKLFLQIVPIVIGIGIENLPAGRQGFSLVYF